MSGGSVDLTGGPFWHARALWRRTRLWNGFRHDLKTWLSEWRVRAQELVLIGPSAGWCLPEDFLRGFSIIHAMDPDPFAPVLFRLNHTSVRMGDWRRGDFFVEGDDFLTRYSGAAVLFCNILGQRRYVNRDIASVEQEMQGLKTRLRAHEWASFHDFLSGDGLVDHSAKRLVSALDPESVLSSFGLSGEWLDHLTGDVLPRTQTRLMIPWQFAPGRLHLVEAGYGNV